MFIETEVKELTDLVLGYNIMASKEELPKNERAIYASVSDYINSIAGRLKLISISQSAVSEKNRYEIALDVFKEFHVKTLRGIMPNDFTRWLEIKQKT